MTYRIIYIPGVDETIPDGAKFYNLPITGPVIDVLVPDSFTTSGSVLHNSLTDLRLSEPYIHHFAGWEI